MGGPSSKKDAKDASKKKPKKPKKSAGLISFISNTYDFLSIGLDLVREAVYKGKDMSKITSEEDAAIHEIIIEVQELITAKEFVQAQKKILQIFAKQPANMAAILAQIHLHQKQHNLTAALQWFDKLENAESQDLILLKKGKIQYYLGMIENATETFTKIVKRGKKQQQNNVVISSITNILQHNIPAIQNQNDNLARDAVVAAYYWLVLIRLEHFQFKEAKNYFVDPILADSQRVEYMLTTTVGRGFAELFFELSHNRLTPNFTAVQQIFATPCPEKALESVLNIMLQLGDYTVKLAQEKNQNSQLDTNYDNMFKQFTDPELQTKFKLFAGIILEVFGSLQANEGANSKALALYSDVLLVHPFDVHSLNGTMLLV